MTRGRSEARTVLRAGGVRVIGAVTLVPVERVWLQGTVREGTLAVFAGRSLEALVVHDGAGLRAIDAGGGSVSLAELLERVDGLAAMLAS